jgi:hypothetical protein
MHSQRDMGRKGSQSDYAKHIGVSRQHVGKLAKQERLVRTADGMVDFDASDRKVRQSSDLGKANNGRNAGGRGNTGALHGDGGVGDLFRKAQTQERAYAARLLELRFKRESGELVPIADVRAAYSRRISTMRDLVRQMVSRLTPVLAAEADEAKVGQLLENEFDLFLGQVSQ